MLISAACMTCLNPELIDVDFGDQGWKDVTCPSMHESTWFLSDPYYALLYERALGNYSRSDLRSTVIDAYTSYEVFLSHFSRCAIYNRAEVAPGTDLLTHVDGINTRLKLITRSAERTIGAAFAIAQLIDANAPKHNEEISGTRNAVVHAGLHPEQSAAEGVLRYVYETVRKLEEILFAFREQNGIRQDYVDYWGALIAGNWKRAEAWSGKRIVSVTLACSLSPRPLPPISWQVRVDEYRSGKRRPRVR